MPRPRSYVVEFWVQGVGEFPLDMLRYEKCYPRSEEDSHTMHDRERDEPRMVHLQSVRPIDGRAAEALLRYPTEGRWESFGWRVVNTPTVEEVK